jgi:hypothetical protein
MHYSKYHSSLWLETTPLLNISISDQVPCQTWWFHCPFLFILGLSTNMVQYFFSLK